MIPLNEDERRNAARLIDQTLGDEIAAFARRPDLEDVAVNPNGRGFAYTGSGKFRLETRFRRDDIGQIVSLAARFNGQVAEAGKSLSFSANLPGHIRFQGGLEPRSTDGPYFVLRFLPKVVREFNDYINDGAAPIVGKTTGLYDLDMVDEQENVGVGLPTMDCIAAAMAARLTIVVFGETGSGKTSLLMSMANHPVVAPDRIITLEDTKEMQFPRVEDVLCLSSVGVDMGELLRDSLRCRPDRTIVGEVRDGAMWVFINSQYADSSGGFVSMHATNPKDFFDRVEQMIAMAGIDPAGQRRVIMKALKRIVWIKRRPGGGRDIVGVYRPTGYDPAKGYGLQRIDVPHPARMV